MPDNKAPPFDVSSKPVIYKLFTPASVGTVAAVSLAFYPGNGGIKLPLADRIPGVTQVLGIVSHRVYIIAMGFAMGFGVMKCVNWARWRTLKSLFSYTGWVSHAKSVKTKAWAVLIKLLKGKEPYNTYTFQKLLPKQRLPDLNKTLDKWLRVSRQFVSEDEFLQTKQAVEQFRTTEGPKLQKRLRERSRKTENWLSEYWLTAAYLSNRQPTAVHNNYYVTNAVPPYVTSDPMTRAATSVYLGVEFADLLFEGKVHPVMLQDMVPLCMAGYRYIYNTTRVPGEHMDSIVRYPEDRHLIVIRNGHYFVLNAYADGKNNKKRRLTAEEFKTQFRKICNMAEGMKEELPVAALTAQDRPVWAKHRDLLQKKNKETLHAVESAMFIVSLDKAVPQDIHAHAKTCVTGNGDDRWFDKCFTMVIFGNTWWGANVEHSVIDATTFVTMSEYIMAKEKYHNGDITKDPRYPHRELPTPKTLTWDLTGMEKIVDEANLRFKNLSDDLELYVVNTDYGKGFMKKKRLSPDGFLQMVLQLAYYRDHKEIPKTYEPSSGRLFLLGRTETVHPSSPEAVAWVKAMDDPGTMNATKIEFLKTAVKKQTQFRIDATVGEGCDRHLLALYCASRELSMDVPQIFRDKAWMMPFKLSTSQTPTRIMDYKPDLQYTHCAGGFAPSCPDGYGISYCIMGEDLINIHITSWKSCKETDSAKMAAGIRKALVDMRKLLSEV